MALTFKVGFQVDTKSFSGAFKDLTDALQGDINRAFSLKNQGGIGSELSEAVKQAQALENALKRATTGKGVSFSALNGELTKMGTSVGEVLGSLAGAGPAFSNSFNAATSAISKADKGLISLNGHLAEMRRVMTQSVKFTMAANVQQAIAEAFSEAIQWTKDLDEALTNISVVAGKTGTALEGTFDKVIKKSRELQVNAKDYAEASLIYYQQGLDDAEVERRTDITIQSAEAAGQSVTTMASQLTAVWNTYSMVGDEQRRAASVGAKLAAETAVDFKDIAEGMQISASAAAQMGVSYDSLAAIIATVGDTTQQSASVIGNAFKTIFSRFYNLKSSGEEGEVELGRISEQLKELGINITDAAGELIPLDNLIMSLGESWDTYSQKQQIAIAETVGGTRQYGQFLALMNNFDKYLNLLNNAQNENGSALTQQYTASLNDIETAATNAKEEWSIAFNKLIDDDVLKDLYSVSETMAKLFGSAIEGAGGFYNILLLIGGYIMRQLTPNIISSAASIKTAFQTITPAGRERVIDRNVAKAREVSGKDYDRKISVYENELKGRQNGDSSLRSSSLKNMTNAQVEAQLASLQRQKTLADQQLVAYGKIEKIQGRISDLEKNGSAQAQIKAKMLRQQIDVQSQIIQSLQQETLELQHQIDLSKRQTETRAKVIGNQLTNYEQVDTGMTSAINNATTHLAEATPESGNAKYKKLAVNRYSQLTDAAQRGNKDAKSMINLMNQYNKAMDKLKAGDQEAAKDLERIVEEMNNLQSSTQETIKSLKKQKTELEGTSQILTEALNWSEIGDEAEDADERIQQVYENIGNALNNMNVDDSIGAIFSGAAIDTEQRQEEIANLLNNLDQVTDVEGNRIFSDADITAIGQLNGNVDALRERLIQLGLTSDQVDAQLNDLGRSANVQQLAQGLMDAATAGMMLYSGVTMVTGSLVEFGDSSGSTSEAVLGLMSGLMTTIPAVIMLFKALKMAIEATGRSAAAAFAPAMAATIAITAILSIVSFLFQMEEKRIEKAKEAAETAEEQAQKTRELSSALEEQTKTVEENYNSWQEAIRTGEDAAEAYDTLRLSLINLNTSMKATGEHAQELNALMTQALSTGDFTAYYKKLQEAQDSLILQSIKDTEDAIEKRGDAYLQEFGTTVYDDAGNGTRKGGGTYFGRASDKNSALGRYMEANDMVNFSERYFEDAAGLVEEYERLLDIQNDLYNLNAESEAEQKEIDNITEGISKELSEMSETYEAIKEEQQAIIDQAQTWYDEILAAQEEQENFADRSYSDNLDYLTQLAADIRNKYSDVLSEDQMNTLFTSTVSSNAGLNQTLSIAQQIEQIQANIYGQQEAQNISQALANKNMLDYYEARKQNIDEVNSKELDYASLTEEQAKAEKDRLEEIGSQYAKMKEIQVDLWQKEKEIDNGIFDLQGHDFLDGERDKYIKEDDFQDKLVEAGFARDEIQSVDQLTTELNKLEEQEQSLKEETDRLNAQMEELGFTFDEASGEWLLDGKSLESIKQAREELDNFYNQLSYEDREVLLKVGVDFVDTKEDLQQKLNTYYQDLSLRVSLNIFSDEEWMSKFEEAQALQDLMQNIVDEYKEYGEISVDSAYELIAAGHADYVTKVGDAYKLTNIAAEEFNGTLDTQREAVDNMLEGLEKAKDPILTLNEELGQINATFANEIEDGTFEDNNLKTYFEQARKACQDLAKTTDITMDDLLGYFSQLDSLVKNMDWENISSENFEEGYTGLFKTGEQVAYTMNQITAAAEAGKVSAEDYTKAWNQINTTYQTVAQEGKNMAYSGIVSMFEAAGIEEGSTEWEKAFKVIEDGEGTLEDFNKIIDNNAEKFGENRQVVKELAEDYKTFEESFNNLEFSQNNLEVGDKIQKELSSAQSVLDDFFTEDYKLNVDVDPNLKLGDLEGQVGTEMQNVASKILTEAKNLKGNLRTEFSEMLTNMGMDATSIMNGTANVQAVAANMTVGNMQTLVTKSQSISKDSMMDTQSAVNAMLAEMGDSFNAFDYTISVTPSGSLSFSNGGLIGLITGKTTLTDFEGGIDLKITGYGTSGSVDLTNASNYLNGPADVGPVEPVEVEPFEFGSDSLDEDDGGGGGGSGGGSGSEFSPTEVMNVEDSEKFHERYEDLTKAIDKLTESMEDLSSAADDAWGSRKVRAMQQYNAQIQKRAQLQKELIAETKKFQKEDKEALLNSSPEIKAIAKFSPGENGVLENPEAIRRYLENEARAAAEELANAQKKYNNAKDSSDAAQEALDQAKTKYDDRIAELTRQNELLDQLQETEDLYIERMNEQIEAIRDWMSNKVEEATYRMEFEITINDRDISWLEHMIDRWGDIGLQTGKTWDWLNQTANDAFDNFAATEKNANRMLEILSNINNPDNQKWFKDTFGDEAWNEYMYTGKMPEEVMSQLERDWDDMLSFAEDIYDAAEKMLESYVTTLESFMDDFDKIADKLQQQNDRLDMYQELLELSGQQYGESGRQARQDLANAKFDNAATEVERAAGALEVAKAGAEEAQKTLDEFYAEHGKDPNNWTTGEAFFANSLEQQLEEANSILADAQGDMTASIQELAQAAADAMEVMAETIKEEIVENLGGDFVDFDSMTTMYDQQYDLDHFFLEDYDKNYQLDKLLGQIDDQMENITDPARMEEYKKLIDEINAANQEGVDITQTDVDLLNAKFELQKAQDAYEEAQNAKNTMRLARDASGNWNYVYSTDESQTEDAAQALADAQYNYDKLLHEARDESSQLWMQAQQEFFEFQETIDRARYESDEKYRAQIDQQMAYYQEKTRLYSEQVIKYNGMLGDDFKDTTLGVITNYGSMEEAQAAYTTQHENYNNQLNESNTLYQEKVKEICDKVGINYEDLAGEIETETEKMQASNNQLKENIKDLSTQGTNALRKLGEETRSWANNMISMIDMVEQSLAKLKNTLDSLGEASLEEMDRGTGFNAMTDYTAVIGNYLYDNLVGPGSANGIWSAEEKREWAMDQLENGYLGDVVAELHNKINDEMLASLGHTVVGHQSWDETIANIKKMIEAAIAGTLERAENEIDESEASKEYNDKYGNTSQIGFATGALVTKPITANLAEDGAELVLNSDDTKNILAAVKTMREVVSFKINQVSANLGQKVESGIDKTIITNDNQQIDQQVHIDATFPNVSVAAEIEEAFSNLVNQAVQYASSKNRKS